MSKIKKTEKVELVEYSTVELDKLVKSKNTPLELAQINQLLSPTPKSCVYKRNAKGGGVWSYVTGNYVKKVLNMVFGFNWDFEIVSWQIMHPTSCVVVGKLTCRTGGETIVKNQFGRCNIKYLRKKVFDDAGEPIMEKNKWGKMVQKTELVRTEEFYLDIGNDLKGAATDAMKKCANMLGVGDDVYAPDEFKKVEVVEKAVEVFEFDGVEHDTKVQMLMAIGEHLETLDTQGAIEALVASYEDFWMGDAQVLELVEDRKQELIRNAAKGGDDEKA